MRFSAVSPVFVKLGRQVSYFLQLLRWFVLCCQAGKQFSARTPVISKVCQTGNQYSAVYPVICIVCQTDKQFSAVTPVIAKVFQTSKRFLQLLQSFAKFARQVSSFLQSFRLFVEFLRQVSGFPQLLWSFVKLSGWYAVFCSFSGFCKAWQAGKLFSAITPIIGKVCQASKQFFAFIPVFIYCFRQVTSFLQLLLLFVKLVR